MKLIGVAHLHIFARCPVVVIQGPVVTRFWCLVHWSAKISWTDVIGNNVRRRAQGFGIVEGIAPGTHVLVFTTQVKVRVHVDQIGELIVQISGRCTTCTTIELKSGCSSHLFNHTIYTMYNLLTKQNVAVHPRTDGLHSWSLLPDEACAHIARRLRLCDGARIAWRRRRRSWVRLSTTILCVNDLLLDPPWKALIQLVEFITRHLSLVTKFEGLRSDTWEIHPLESKYTWFSGLFCTSSRSIPMKRKF